MAFQPPIQNAESIMRARLQRQHLLNILAARIRALSGAFQGPGNLNPAQPIGPYPDGPGSAAPIGPYPGGPGGAAPIGPYPGGFGGAAPIGPFPGMPPSGASPIGPFPNPGLQGTVPGALGGSTLAGPGFGPIQPSPGGPISGGGGQNFDDIVRYWQNAGWQGEGR